MNRLIKILSLTLLMGVTLTASAVTQKEMDQARALAAKAYLRYANDGSGYLDQISPSSMADLEKQLKTKEKENIKAFKSISLPSGYESWSKEQLVEFWGKAFSTPGLIEKGRGGRTRAKKYISDMKIAAPAPKEADAKEAAPKGADAKEAAPKGADAKEAAPKGADAKEAAPKGADSKGGATAATDSARATLEKAESIVENGLDAVDTDPQISKVKDHSMVYVIILIILVAAVVALVVFAANVMKKNAESARRNAPDSAPVPDGGDDSRRVEELREKFAATLSSKNNEIAGLTRKLETASAQNAALKKNIENLTAEVAGLRNQLAVKEAAVSAPAPREAASAPKAASQAASQQAGQAAPLRTIYLGKVNSKGIFIRADRTLNPGNSVYRLDTADGYSGSFRVADDPVVWEMALLTPRETLAGGCIADDIEDTAGMERIVNDAAGTAIFDNGCWKVLRKGKIHYE